MTKPALPGASIRIERLGASGWVAVGEAVVDRRGRFAAKLRLSPGVYRARVVATAGLASRCQQTVDDPAAVRRALALALSAALALACCTGAQAARVAVGLEEGVTPSVVATLIEEATGSPVDRSLEPLGVLVVSVEDPDARGSSARRPAGGRVPRGADSEPLALVRAGRPVLPESVVPRGDPRVRFLGRVPTLRGVGARRGDRFGYRRVTSGVRRPDRRGEELRQHALGQGHVRPRDDGGGRDRGEHRQRTGNRRARAAGQAPRREGDEGQGTRSRPRPRPRRSSGPSTAAPESST